MAVESVERTLLCAMSLNQENFNLALSTGLTAEHFLLEEIAIRVFSNIPVPFNDEIQTVAAKLDEDGIQRYARAVMRAQRRRSLENLLHQARSAYQKDQPIGDILVQIDNLEKDDQPKLTSAPEAITNACFELTLKKNNPSFIHLGIPVVDQSIFLEPGNLALLVSRPGNGKTALALWIAEKVARQKKKVLFFSLELKENEIALRIAARMLGKNYSSLRQESEESEINRLYASAGELPESLFFCDSAYSARQIEWLVKKSSPDLVVIDYIGLVEYKNIQEDTPRVSAVSRWTKRMAMKYDTTVLALHQLNRETENRNGASLKMRYIRDTGQLEQDASVILAVYPQNEDEVPPPPRRNMIFDVIKNRNGQLRRIPFVFNMPVMDFEFPESVPAYRKNTHKQEKGTLN